MAITRKKAREGVLVDYGSRGESLSCMWKRYKTTYLELATSKINRALYQRIAVYVRNMITLQIGMRHPNYFVDWHFSWNEARLIFRGLDLQHSWSAISEDYKTLGRREDLYASWATAEIFLWESYAVFQNLKYASSDWNYWLIITGLEAFYMFRSITIETLFDKHKAYIRADKKSMFKNHMIANILSLPLLFVNWNSSTIFFTFSLIQILAEVYSTFKGMSLFIKSKDQSVKIVQQLASGRPRFSMILSMLPGLLVKTAPRILETAVSLHFRSKLKTHYKSKGSAYIINRESAQSQFYFLANLVSPFSGVMDFEVLGRLPQKDNCGHYEQEVKQLIDLYTFTQLLIGLIIGVSGLIMLYAISNINRFLPFKLISQSMVHSCSALGTWLYLLELCLTFIRWASMSWLDRIIDRWNPSYAVLNSFTIPMAYAFCMRFFNRNISYFESSLGIVTGVYYIISFTLMNLNKKENLDGVYKRVLQPKMSESTSIYFTCLAIQIFLAQWK